jgi:hypothetical protein
MESMEPIEIMNTRLPKKHSYSYNDLSGIAKRCDYFIHMNQMINHHNIEKPRTIFISTYMGQTTLLFFIDNILPLVTSPCVLVIASEDYTFPNSTGDSRVHTHYFHYN